jgi:hypothetical protein
MRIPRKAAIALLAGVCIAGVAGASAAGLGGATSGSLGAENPTVAGCDTTGVTIGYNTAYNATTQKYEVSGVNVGSVDPACAGKAAAVTLRSSTGVALGTGSVASIVLTTAAFTIPVTPGADANATVGVSLIISG